MKTFEEAIKVVCIGDMRDPKLCEAVQDKQIRSKSMIKEVVKSSEAHFLAIALIDQISMVEFEFESFVICIKNAIAQGVLIGMEMEKNDEKILS